MTNNLTDITNKPKAKENMSHKIINNTNKTCSLHTRIIQVFKHKQTIVKGKYEALSHKIKCNVTLYFEIERTSVNHNLKH